MRRIWARSTPWSSCRGQRLGDQPADRAGAGFRVAGGLGVDTREELRGQTDRHPLSDTAVAPSVSTIVPRPDYTAPENRDRRC